LSSAVSKKREEKEKVTVRNAGTGESRKKITDFDFVTPSPWTF
jgi:hypothetical protein